jgi:hypothetical protein
MTCDKCGGLVVADDEEVLKCVACSKRFYLHERERDGQPRMAMNTAPPTHVTPRRCQAILEIRGTQCSAYPRSGKPFCKRHQAQQDPEQWARPATTKEKTMASPQEGKHPVPAVMNHRRVSFQPVSLKFQLSREAVHWAQFVAVWGRDYADYELDWMERERDETPTLTVYLRPVAK